MPRDAGDPAPHRTNDPHPTPPHHPPILRGGGVAMLAIFLLSGASGLVYQVVWSRALTLVFGSTTQGVATVLAAFMGGLALGSWIAARVGDRVTAPLRVYGLLEGGIALLSLAVLLLMPVLEGAYRALYEVVHLSLPGLTLVRFLLAAAFLVPTTTLMGATLPILSAYFENRGRVEGQGASILYAVNTVGAVVGTAAAGFILLPALGMRATVLLAAGINLLACLGALALSRKVEEGGRRILIPFADRGGRDRGAADPPRVEPLSPASRSAVAAAIALSGAGALILEVVWTRTLSLILGSSTHAFTLMLTTFLVGLALGSAAAGRLLPRIRDPLAAFSRVELGAGLAVYAGVYLFPELPYLFLELFRSTREAPLLFDAGRFVLAASVMLAPTLLLGATFPLAIRCQRLDTEEAARPVGFLYAVNTLGAIVGSLAAGFLLIPALGLRRTVIVGALVNLSVGAFLLALSPTTRRVMRYGLAGALVLLMPGLLLGAPPWNPMVMTSGVFKYAPTYADLFPTRKEFLDYHESHEQLFYRDGRTTTVTVEKRPMRRDGKVWLVLTVNGKVDASSVGDMATQVLLGQLPMLLSPEARDVLVIGWGSGVTAGSVLTHQRVASLKAIEIEPAILEASLFFEDFNRSPEKDPRLLIEINDARHSLLVDRNRYDVIISEPSNPWLSGPSRLFTREFFELVKGRLAPGGILCQWVQLYGLEVESYQALLRTLGSAFEEVAVFKGSPGDTLVLASDSPIRPSLAAITAQMADETVAGDLLRAKVRTPADLLTRFRVGGDEVLAVVGEGPLNTDDNALVEFAASRSLHVTTDFENDRILSEASSSILDRIDLKGADPETASRFPLDLAQAHITGNQPHRATQILKRFAAREGLAPEHRAEMLSRAGDLLEKGGEDGQALEAWREALEMDPDCLPAILSLGRYQRVKAERPEETLALLERAARDHPEDPALSLELGRTLLDLGRAEEAVEILVPASRLDPPDGIAPYLHMEWGRACYAMGDTDCAIRELLRYFRGWRKIPKPAEVSIKAAIDLGRSYLEEGREPQALEYFRVASEMGNSLANWHKNEAADAVKQGDMEKAERRLRLAIEWHATDPQAYHTLGDLFMRQARWEEAHALWTELLLRRPDDALAIRGAVEALSRMGRLPEAAPLIRRLIDLEENPERMAELRSVLRKALGAP